MKEKKQKDENVVSDAFDFEESGTLEVINADDSTGVFSLDGEPEVKTPEQPEAPKEENQDADKKTEKNEEEIPDSEKTVVKNDDGKIIIEGDTGIEDIDETKDTSGNYYMDLYDNLREIGVIQGEYEFKEGYSLDNDGLIEILDEEKRNGAMELYKKEILEKIADDDDALAFIKFKLGGGATADFFKAYSGSNDFNVDGNIKDSKYQDDILRYYYSNFSELSTDEIEDQIEMLADSGKKEKYAEKYIESIKREINRKKEDLEKQNQIKAKQAEDMRKSFANGIGSAITGMDTVNGIPFTDERKKKIYSMITQDNVKTQDGSVMSEFSYRLRSAINDPSKCVLLADFLANDLDIGKYEKRLETNVTRQIRKNLIMNRPSPAKKKSGGSDWF